MEHISKNNKTSAHYICLGGCKGVSQLPGVCAAPDCANHEHELVHCDCSNERHHDFKIATKSDGPDTNTLLTDKNAWHARVVLFFFKARSRYIAQANS